MSCCVFSQAYLSHFSETLVSSCFLLQFVVVVVLKILLGYYKPVHLDVKHCHLFVVCMLVCSMLCIMYVHMVCVHVCWYVVCMLVVVTKGDSMQTAAV